MWGLPPCPGCSPPRWTARLRGSPFPVQRVLACVGGRTHPIPCDHAAAPPRERAAAAPRAAAPPKAHHHRTRSPGTRSNSSCGPQKQPAPNTTVCTRSAGHRDTSSTSKVRCLPGGEGRGEWGGAGSSGAGEVVSFEWIQAWRLKALMREAYGVGKRARRWWSHHSLSAAAPQGACLAQPRNPQRKTAAKMFSHPQARG